MPIGPNGEKRPAAAIARDPVREGQRMALSNRAKLGIIIAVSVIAGLMFAWLALLLSLLAAFLIAWGQSPEQTEAFVKGLPGDNSTVAALDKWL
jgi:hypothetical protein